LRLGRLAHPPPRNLFEPARPGRPASLHFLLYSPSRPCAA
jgi:hypothetical protein